MNDNLGKKNERRSVFSVNTIALFCQRESVTQLKVERLIGGRTIPRANSRFLLCFSFFLIRLILFNPFANNAEIGALDDVKPKRRCLGDFNARVVWFTKIGVSSILLVRFEWRKFFFFANKIFFS